MTKPAQRKWSREAELEAQLELMISYAREYLAANGISIESETIRKDIQEAERVLND